jgi:hypothetical protein
LVLDTDGIMTPIGLMDREPDVNPWVAATVVSPGLARAWLANGLYVGNANRLAAICVDAALDSDVGRMKEAMIICGTVPESRLPHGPDRPVTKGAALVLPADFGECLAQGIRQVARTAGLP